MALSSSSSSFLGLEGLHVFVTGAAGGIGSRAVREFLDQGCNVTAHDLRTIQIPIEDGQQHARLHTLTGDISDEESIRSCFEQALRRFGPVNILIANAGVTDESSEYPIWDLPLDLWERMYRTNVRGTFLTIKYFLRAARNAQDALGRELENLAIVVTGSETGKFGQAGHSEYASGKAGLQYGLVRGVKNEIVRLNSRARINAVAPGWVDAPMIEGRLDDPGEMWAEAKATVPLRKIAKPEDVARAMAFLASHRAAGHISGECLSVDGGMEGRLIWRENEIVKTSPTAEETRMQEKLQMTIPRGMPTPKRNKIRVVFTIDLDAVSGWLGTGKHPDNVLADYSSGFFAARVGVPRLVRMLKKLGIADRCTWFIPGHSAESFPEEVRQVVETGCEIGLHGYAHEGAYQMSVQQERDVLERCIEIARKLTGKKPVGYRAPLYQVRESTLDLLEEYGFEYDASLTDHDCRPFFAPRRPPIQPIDFSLPASSWMHPIPAPSFSASNPQNDQPSDRRPLVCLPCNWYMEDMTPMQYLPHLPNSHGYVDVRVIEQLWRDRFLWIRENETSTSAGTGTGTGTSDTDPDDNEDTDNGPIFPLVIHPDTSGMAHVIGMVERMLTWLRGWAEVGEVEFCQAGEVAGWFREKEMGR